MSADDETASRSIEDVLSDDLAFRTAAATEVFEPVVEATA